MAAAAAQMRTFLREVIGIADSPVPELGARREAVREEGLETISDLADFDEDDVKILCASVRKPGGTVTDPHDEMRRIPNPGFSIPAIAEKRLKLACYGAKIYRMLGRPITNESLNRARLRQFEEHQLTIKEHEEPESLPTISKHFEIMKALDMFPIHLRERIGTRKVALMYVIRDEENPAMLEPLGDDRVTSDSYGSLMEEMIARTPLVGTEYHEDNARVYQMLQELVGGSSHESSIKAHRRDRDGRGAYFSLVQHNLGSSKWDKIIEGCENYILRVEWNGKNIRFTLKMHIAKHRDAHNELVRASQFVQYEVPNDHTRVSRLLKSITSKDGAILAAITHIQGTPLMRDNFEQAADFLLLTAPAPKEIMKRYRISALASSNDDEGEDAPHNGSGKNKKNGGIGKSGVELRYHTRKEYGKLNGRQRSELHEWRKSNKSGSNIAKKKEEDANLARISSLETQLKDLLDANNEMKSKISALTSNQSGRDPLSNPLNQRNSS